MINWIKKHLFTILTIFIISILPLCIVANIIHYNSEPISKVYIEYNVYDGLATRHYSGTYEMKGKEFIIQNYWQSSGKHRGSYRVVRIVDKATWGGYFNKQSVCIYTGMNDIEVKILKVLETKY
jgi:hypothetical protein